MPFDKEQDRQYEKQCFSFILSILSILFKFC